MGNFSHNVFYPIINRVELSSADAFNLVRSRGLSFGRGLNGAFDANKGLECMFLFQSDLYCKMHFS